MRDDERQPVDLSDEVDGATTNDGSSPVQGGATPEDDAQATADTAAKAMFDNDRVAHDLAMDLVSVTPGHAVIKMTVAERMVNGHDICHGGYLFTLADSAFAYACNSWGPVTVASGCQIEFLRPAPKGMVLTATAKGQNQSKRRGVYDVEITDPDGRKVALFRGISSRIG